MTMYEFGGYTVRMATPADRELLRQWIAADADHAPKNIPPEFFTDEEPGVGCYVLCDAQGPLFFVRTSNVVRLDTQFGPAVTDDERERNRAALVAGMDWLAQQCAMRGATEILFQTNNRPLAWLATHQMGCERSPNELVRSLEVERCGLKIVKPQGEE